MLKHDLTNVVAYGDGVQINSFIYIQKNFIDDENDSGDEDGRDDEVPGKESDSETRDGGGVSGMGSGVYG